MNLCFLWIKYLLMRIGNCIVTPKNESKKKKKISTTVKEKIGQKSVRDSSMERKGNEGKVDVFRMVRKLNPTAKVKYRNLYTYIRPRIGHCTVCTHARKHTE